MKEKRKAFEVPSGMIDALRRGGEVFRDGNVGHLKRIAANGAVFAVSLVFSATEVTMGVYPFGVAAMCAVSGTEMTAAAFSGAVLGTLGMRHNTLWQIIVIIAAFAARICAGAAEGAFSKREGVLRRLFNEPVYIRVTISAASAVGVGMVGILTGEGLYYSIFSALAGVVLYTLSCAAFAAFFDMRSSSSARAAGICVFLFAVSLAIGSVSLPFSPLLIVAFMGSVYFTMAGGVTYGIAAGMSMGLACGGMWAPVFPITAVVYATAERIDKTLAVILAGICGTGWCLLSSGLAGLTEIVPELCLAMALTVPLVRFGVMPTALPALFDISDNFKAENIAEKKMALTGSRYAAISSSLSSLSKMLYSVSDKMRCPSPQESYRICTATRARYCSVCEHEKTCAGQCEKEVGSFFDNMAHRLSASGRVSARLVPEGLARRCYNMDRIIDAVNTSAKRVAGMSSACERTELFASDYTAIAGLLKDVSESEGDWEKDINAENELGKALSREGLCYRDASVYGGRSKHIYLRGIDLSVSSAGERDIRECAESIVGGKLSSPEFSLDNSCVSASMHTVQAYKIKSGRYSNASLRDSASGDSVTSFKNSEGYYYTLVSDGMGSGREAALISGVSSVFLEKLLSAGCPMKSALEMLNCFVRGSEGERFTTVDLMEADLYTGRARFIKSGAAPSFVIRDGQLFRLHSKTVPVGIMRALDAEAISFDLHDGDTVIMMSDGVTGSYEECPWLYEMLCGTLTNIDSPAQAARLIGEAAAKNTGRDDDITVCVMKVSRA